MSDTLGPKPSRDRSFQGGGPPSRRLIGAPIYRPVIETRDSRDKNNMRGRGKKKECGVRDFAHSLFGGYQGPPGIVFGALCLTWDGIWHFVSHVSLVACDVTCLADQYAPPSPKLYNLSSRGCGRNETVTVTGQRQVGQVTNSKAEGRCGRGPGTKEHVMMQGTALNYGEREGGSGATPVPVAVASLNRTGH